MPLAEGDAPRPLSQEDEGRDHQMLANLTALLEQPQFSFVGCSSSEYEDQAPTCIPVLPAEQQDQTSPTENSTHLVENADADEVPNLVSCDLWRKYGQNKIVRKGILVHRFYFSCKKPGCPVKKKVVHFSDLRG